MNFIKILILICKYGRVWEFLDFFFFYIFTGKLDVAYMKLSKKTYRY